MNQVPTKQLPKELTSYDLLKSLAVITMIIDHLGYYFFPEVTELRIIGRTSMPIWLFLIGYARSRDTSSLLWAGAGVLVIGDLVAGMPIFALNIIVTILIVRYLLDSIMDFALLSVQNMFLVVLGLALLVLPSIYVFDYGTQAILYAMFGYMVRNQKKINFSNEAILLFMGVVFIVHVSYQKLIFGLDNQEAFTMGAGILLVCIMLTQFKSSIYTDLTKKLPDFVNGTLKLMGRHTLEIYIAHLMLFKAIGLLYFSWRFQLFQWSWF